MNPERNKIYALVLLAGALTLLALSTAGLDGRLLSLPQDSRPVQLDTSAAVNRFGALFSAETFAKLLKGGERRDVFATTHFDKPPPPSKEPEKPKTKSVALTFLGTLSSSQGEVSAFLRLDQDVMKLSPGAKVIQDWVVAAVNGSALVLTNATQTNQIPFRQTLQLTVPLP